MKLKIIICIITGIAISQFINIVTPAMSNSDHILPTKIEGSFQYNDGKFNDKVSFCTLFIGPRLTLPYIPDMNRWCV